MEPRAGTHRLAEFRAKTDYQLHALIANRLDRGLSFARLLLDPEVRERWASVDEFTNNAEKAYREAAHLMPVLRDIPVAERRRLESRLLQLREILDCAAICAGPRMQAAAML